MFKLIHDGKIRHVEISQSGIPEVVNDYHVDLLSAAQITELTDQYGQVDQLIQDANALAKAQIIFDRGAPDLVNGRKTYDVLDEQDNVVGTQKYPEWQIYDDAKALVENASANAVSLTNVFNDSNSDLSFMSVNTVINMVVDSLAALKVAAIKTARQAINRTEQLTLHELGISTWQQFEAAINAANNAAEIDALLGLYGDLLS